MSLGYFSPRSGRAGAHRVAFDRMLSTLFVPALVVASPASFDASVAFRAGVASRGLSPDEIVAAFESSSSISEFARRAVAGADDGPARAHRLYDAILELKRSGSIEGDRNNTPKVRRPKTADELLRAARDQHAGDRRAGCYELSALFVAAGRSIGLDVVGVERDEAAGTGQIGHVMAGVRFEEGGRLTIFDLQNETRGSRWRIRELGDFELAAHHYNHIAVAAFLRGALDAARRAIDVALALAPDAPSFLNNRATILAGQGEPILAMAEAVYAVHLAPDVPLYRYQLGRLHLMVGEVERAIEVLGQALELQPRYGLARRDLGWAYLLANQPQRAERELRRAMRDDANTPDGELYLGLLLLTRGDRRGALEIAAMALKKDASSEALAALRRMASGSEAGGEG
ncbi:MAG: tetratricopeptide repeat protein, partial [Myxococcota bacterium]